MNKIYFKEIFEYPITEFKYHLENDLNDRIFFSGKYGIGKTSFLEDFFKSSNQQEILGSEKYDVFRVFPVNYSISSNEDIIKYLKYDIVIELLKKKTQIEEIDLGFIDTLPVYLKNNLHKVAAAMVLMIPKLGKDVVEIFEKIDKLKEEFLKFHEESSESAGDKMIAYLEQIEMKEGGIYENDVVTKLISNTISKTKPKESILIVDDIDRLDPEHVFRILNVFASHFDSNNFSGQKNKFNFDKIIIVCDFNNIRNVYHHKYGSNVDFMGYIDKFYSSDIYYFDNRKAIKGVILEIFQTIKFKLNTSDSSEEPTLKKFYFSNGFLGELLQLFLDRSYIGLRNIIKMNQKVLRYHFEEISFDDRNRSIYAYRVPLTMQLKLLRDFLGDSENMIKVFRKCLVRNEQLKNHDYYFEHLLYIFSNKNHSFHREETYVFLYKGQQFFVDAKTNSGNSQIRNVNVFQYAGDDQNGKPLKGETYDPSTELFWQLAIDVTEQLVTLGYL